MRTRWLLKVLLCECMNLLAHHTENYFFNAKSLTLTASKNINFYLQIRMFWLSQQNTPTLDTVHQYTLYGTSFS